MAGVHALTDVTGFGLLGHLLEVCRGANLGATLETSKLPILPAAIGFAQLGIGPGAIGRNLASFGESVAFDASVPDWQRSILADAQTSGGLLASVAPESVDEVLALFRAQGFADAAVIAQLQAGAAQITVK